MFVAAMLAVLCGSHIQSRCDCQRDKLVMPEGFMIHVVQSHCLHFCDAHSCLQIRALLKKREASKYGAKVSAKAQRREHQQQHQLPQDELANVFK